MFFLKSTGLKKCCLSYIVTINFLLLRRPLFLINLKYAIQLESRSCDVFAVIKTWIYYFFYYEKSF